MRFRRRLTKKLGSCFDQFDKNERSEGRDKVCNSRYAGSVGLLPLGLTGLSTENAVVDIVAVHGLNGHRETSWTAANGTFWLQDVLPREIPYSRIFTYGYSSDIARLTQQTLVTQAEKLLQELTRLRQCSKTENRPVIFIGHSLGGLIIKIALILANQQYVDYRDRWKSIRSSVVGILFLGTPQQASPDTCWEWLIRDVMSAVALEKCCATSSDRDLAWMESEQEQYKSISVDVPVICGYETRPTTARLLNRVVVPKFSAVPSYLIESRSFALAKDHNGLSKIYGSKDPDLPIMLHSIKTLCGEAIECATGFSRFRSFATKLQCLSHSSSSVDLSERRNSEHSLNETLSVNSSTKSTTLQRCHSSCFEDLCTAEAEEAEVRRRADSTSQSRIHIYALGAYSVEAMLLSPSLIDLDRTNAFKLESEYRKSIRLWEETSGPNDAKTLQAIVMLAYCYTVGGNYEPAEGLYKRLVLAGALEYGPEHPTTLCMLRNLSALHRLQGNYHEAAAILERLLRSGEGCPSISQEERTSTSPTSGTKTFPDTTDVRIALAINYDSLGRYEDARKLYAEAHRQQTKLLGDDHPETTETARRLELNAQKGRKVACKPKSYEEVFFRKANTFPRTTVPRTLPYPDLSLCDYRDPKSYYVGTEGVERRRQSHAHGGFPRSRAYSF